MNQLDWVEAPKKHKVSITVPDRKPAVARRKAELTGEIADYLRRVPKRVMDGGVQTVRAWKDAVEAARNVVSKRNASTTDLELALKRLRMLESPQ